MALAVEEVLDLYIAQGGVPSCGGAGRRTRRRWELKRRDGGEDDERRGARDEEDELLRSRAPMTYIGADPLAPVRAWNRWVFNTGW